MSNTSFVSLFTFNRSKTIFALLLVSLSIFAGNLRAEDDLYKSPDDLSPAEQQQAKRLQKVFDAENADAKYRHEHPAIGSDDEIHYGEPASSGELIFLLVVFTLGTLALFVPVYLAINKK